jgi:hypothetical protein
MKYLAYKIGTGIMIGSVFSLVVTACTACGARPAAVTLVRVDGGFMSCTTFIEVEGGAR